MSATDIAILIGYHLGAIALGWCAGIMQYSFRRFMEVAT